MNRFLAIRGRRVNALQRLHIEIDKKQAGNNVLRLIGFILFMGGLVTLFDGLSGWSFLTLILGAVLLFSVEPSVLMLGYGVFAFTAFDGFSNGLSERTFAGMIIGLILISWSNRSGAGEGSGLDIGSGDGGDGGGGD
ncbi:hypothetical protein [Amphritea pacifica]|uniref:DUF2892 domain-containing protein n=1 Tax=Amphritea pacifica TaxID=2811233 RepID=A0ABS2W8K5_9GAMM|nr:hypothetical protein [Amphritea pacifica]MBN0988013.1 hypothetical protein [Amphritea pacifica]